MFPSRVLVLFVVATATFLIPDAEARTDRPNERSSAAAFKFPASVGPFRRTKVTNFTPDGSNSAASYSGPTGVMTAYVYPARPPYSPSLGSHFEQCRQEVRQLWSRTRTVWKRPTSITRNGRVYPGIEEVFSGQTPSGGAVSALLVFKADDRYVKFRFTSLLLAQAGKPAQKINRHTAELAAAQAGGSATGFAQRFPWPR